MVNYGDAKLRFTIAYDSHTGVQPRDSRARLPSIPGLLRSRRAHHERIYLPNFAAPERKLHLVSRAHDRHIAHMDIVRDDRQPRRSDLRLIPRWHGRDVVF